ncbi:hypothetical protein AALF15_08135 [Corynebacteriaceae bacterium 7-707]
MEPSPPARYTTDDKLRAAHQGLAAAGRQGLTPLLASVTGSALRGLDHAGSDLDVLVAVADPLPRPVATVSDRLDLTLAAVTHILDRVGESVPYAEWAVSPHMVTQGTAGAAWLPVVRALRPAPYRLRSHAQSMAYRSAARQPDPAKAARLALAAYRFTHTAPGVAVQPRTVFDLRCEEAAAAVDWLSEGADGTPDPRVVRVVELLRNAAGGAAPGSVSR